MLQSLSMTGVLLMLCQATCLGQAMALPQSVYPGRVEIARLVYFVPHGTEGICLSLENDAAVPEDTLSRATREHPDSLALVLCDVQATPNRWKQEARLLAEKLSKKPQQLSARFRLSALLFYEGLRSRQSGQGGDINANLNAAAELCSSVWRESKDPVAGLLLVHMSRVGGAFIKSEINPDGLLDDMVRMLAGERAYQLMEAGRKQGWITQPPDPALTPLANRRALCGVLRKIWSIAGARHGVGQRKNGRLEFIVRQPSAENMRKVAYVNAWRDQLRDSDKTMPAPP